jgi:hypothetical protein
MEDLISTHYTRIQYKISYTKEISKIISLSEQNETIVCK